MFVNLLVNKELSQKREIDSYNCGGCGREYNKANLHYKDNNIDWKGNYPSNGVCLDVYIYLQYFYSVGLINLSQLVMKMDLRKNGTPMKLMPKLFYHSTKN